MLNATIVKRVEITPELIVFGVKPDAGVPDFKPGQYVALALPGSAPRPAHFPPEPEVSAPDKLIKRAYSIGSTPGDKSCFEFYIAILPEGTLTSRLVLLGEGDRVYVAPKVTGTFTTDEVPETHNLVLVSTGTGIAPYISMLRTPRLWTPGRRVILIHGVRFSKDLAYRSELLELQEKNRAFEYHAIISRADESWSGPRGYVQNFFKDEVVKLNPETDHVFVCGNPAMIDDLEALLKLRGYTVHSKRNPGNFHVEKYW